MEVDKVTIRSVEPGVLFHVKHGLVFHVEPGQVFHVELYQGVHLKQFYFTDRAFSFELKNVSNPYEQTERKVVERLLDEKFRAV
jgi:hypothetical protein